MPADFETIQPSQKLINLAKDICSISSSLHVIAYRIWQRIIFTCLHREVHSNLQIALHHCQGQAHFCPILLLSLFSFWCEGYACKCLLELFGSDADANIGD